MPELILASRSPRRIKLLKDEGYEFTIHPSEIEENLDTTIPIDRAIEKLSLEKAEAVAAQYPHDIILAADTMVILDGEPLGKPATKEEAREMLQSLSNRSHEVITGFTIIFQPRRTILTSSSKATVTFIDLPTDVIESYLDTPEPYDKAGGYAVQESAGAWVKNIDGLRSTVIGLPLEEIKPKLAELNVRPKG